MYETLKKCILSNELHTLQFGRRSLMRAKRECFTRKSLFAIPEILEREGISNYGIWG